MNFIDTNILVYAYDRSKKDKYQRAQMLLLDCWNNRSGIISTQVLQEFYVTITKKVSKPLPLQEAREILKELQAWSIYQIDAVDILAASQLQETYKFSFWDALIVTAAQAAGASILYSEDMQHGQKIGTITVTNPFIS